MLKNQADKDKQLLKTTARWVLILQFVFFIVGILTLTLNAVAAFQYFEVWTGVASIVNLLLIVFLFSIRPKNYGTYVVQLILFPFILGLGGMFLALCIAWGNG